MLIKKGDLFEARDIIINKLWLGDYDAIPEDEMMAVNLASALKELVEASNNLTDERKALLDKHGKKNKHGQIIIENDLEGKSQYKVIDKELFNSDIEALFQEEIEVKGLMYEWLVGMKLCPAEINAIKFLF